MNFPYSLLLAWYSPLFITNHALYFSFPTVFGGGGGGRETRQFGWGARGFPSVSIPKSLHAASLAFHMRDKLVKALF